MPKPIENLTGADADAFQTAIEPFVAAILSILGYDSLPGEVTAAIATTTSQAGIATTQAAAAAASALAVAAAMNSSSAPYANAAANYLPQGMAAFSVTARGAGGSDGTNILATFSGGTLQQNPVIRFDIVAGAIANERVVSKGLYIGSGTPTMPTITFPGAAGSPAATLTAGVIVDPGQTYWVASADSSQVLLYGNNAGVKDTAPFGGTQLAMYGKGGVDAAVAAVTNLLSMFSFMSVPGSDYAATFGKPNRPIAFGITPAGLSDFLGVRYLPIAAPDGTISAVINADTNPNSGYVLRAYSRQNKALLFGLTTTGKLQADIDIAEVMAARGTAGSLDARLSRGLTAAGSPKTGAQNVGRLRNLRSVLAYLKNGGSALAHIILDMHSWGDAKTYGTADMITRFFADSGLVNAGPGWIGAASPVSASFGPHGCAQNNISVTRSGTWTDLFRSADGTPGTIQTYPGYDAAQAGADGAIYAFSGSVMGSCISITAYCEKGSGVEQSWDGVVYSSLTVASGTGPTTTAVTPAPSASFTGSITGTMLTISGVTGTVTPEMVLAGTGVLANTKIVSGSGTTWTVNNNHATAIGPVAMTGKSNTLRLRFTNTSKFGGLFGLTSTSGVVFSNFSNSGSTSAQKASVQSNTDYKAIMATLPGDSITALIEMALNDTKLSTPNATIVTNIGTIAAGYRTIYPGWPYCDIAIISEPNCALSVQDTLSPLLRVWAEDNDAAFLDLQPYFGVPAYSGDYSGYGRNYTDGSVSTALPLLEVVVTGTSFRHPSTTAQLTAAGKSPALCGANVVAAGLSNLLLSAVRSN